MPESYKKSYKSGAAITQWECLYRSAADTVVKTTGETDKGFCFAQEAASASGKWISCCYLGPTYAIAAASFSAGDLLTCAANGKVTGWATGKSIVAVALEDAAADSDIVQVCATSADAG